jgi:DNA invertase Pin-like site-specific DNA recombinase
VVCSFVKVVLNQIDNSSARTGNHSCAHSVGGNQRHRLLLASEVISKRYLGEFGDLAVIPSCATDQLHYSGWVSKPQRIIGYGRCSTAEQGESGLGLAAQEATIRAECQRRGWELLDVVLDEGESGKDLNRPGLNSVLERIARGEADGLIAAKLDRISRSVGDFADLLEWFSGAGAALVAVDVGVDTSTPGGKLVCGVFSAVSEWERDVIGQRTREGLAVLREQHRPISRAAVADHPKLAKRIRAMRDKGATYQAIADALNADGVKTLRTAERWTVSGVRGAAGYQRPTARRKRTDLPRVNGRR